MLSPRIAGGKRLPAQAYRIAELILEMTIGLGVPSWELKDQDTIAVLLGFDASDTSKAIARLIRAELLVREDLGRDGWRFALRLRPLVEASKEAISIWSDLARLAAQRTPNLIPPSFDERRDAGLSPALTEVDHESIRQQAASIGRAKPPPAGHTDSRPPAAQSPFDAIRAAIGAPRPKSDGGIPHSAGPGDGPQHQPDGEIPHQVSPGDGSGAAAMGKFPIETEESDGEIPQPTAAQARPRVRAPDVLHVQNVQHVQHVQHVPGGDVEQHGPEDELETEKKHGATPKKRPLRFHDPSQNHAYEELIKLARSDADRIDWQDNQYVWLDRVEHQPEAVLESISSVRDWRARNVPKKTIYAVLGGFWKRIARTAGEALKLF